MYLHKRELRRRVRTLRKQIKQLEEERQRQEITIATLTAEIKRLRAEQAVAHTWITDHCLKL